MSAGEVPPATGANGGCNEGSGGTGGESRERKVPSPATLLQMKVIQKAKARLKGEAKQLGDVKSDVGTVLNNLDQELELLTKMERMAKMEYMFQHGQPSEALLKFAELCRQVPKHGPSPISTDASSAYVML